MTLNPLPPQAYTKETVVKAYQWLQGQPSHIHDLAKTPDILVSMYLKAKLDGESALDRPSIQNFKNDLKSLAGMMSEFEGNPAPISTATMAVPTPMAAPSSSGTIYGGAAAHAGAAFNPPPPQKLTRPEPATTQSVNPALVELDPRTLETLREVMNEYNFSSESEALRVLIALAAKKIRSF